MSDALDLGLHEPDDRTPSSGARAALVATIVAVALLLAGIAYVVGRAAGVLGNAPDYAGPGSGTVVVQVKQGDSVTAMGETLAKAGVVKSARAFRDAAAANDRSGQIGPGYYKLRRHMKASLAVSLMLDPRSLVRSHIVIPEGFTVAQTLQRIARDSDIKLADLQRAAASPAALGLPDYARGRLEGYLFPATYDFPPGTTAEQVLRTMVTRFKQAATDVGLANAMQQTGRSPYDVVVIASLVEREARFSDDFPKVARVVYNRLAKRMKLQFDSTVNYALKANKTYVTNEDIKVASPYNTYLHEGLPPGPIAAPGEQALRAALQPAAGDWLYFVTVDKEGHNEFATTYDQFLKLKAKGEQNR